MIVITFDKESEYLWIRHIVEAGVLNISPDIIKEMSEENIPLENSVTYKKTDSLQKDVCYKKGDSKMKKTVVFDFDGVIHSYKSGWQGPTVIPDEPVEGIKEAIAEIRIAGYEVVVVSTRCETLIGMAAIQVYLEKHGIEFDRIMKEKPPAIVYIDDRAICFDGNAGSLLEKIRNFQPWNKKEKESSAENSEFEEYDEVAKNLIEAMFNFALETDITERDAFYALAEVGIEKEDFDKAGYGEYVQQFYDEEEEKE